jgi:hypothetical protein
LQSGYKTIGISAVSRLCVSGRSLLGNGSRKVGTYELYRVVCNLLNGLPPVYRD